MTVCCHRGYTFTEPHLEASDKWKCTPHNLMRYNMDVTLGQCLLNEHSINNLLGLMIPIHEKYITRIVLYYDMLPADAEPLTWPPGAISWWSKWNRWERWQAVGACLCRWPNWCPEGAPGNGSYTQLPQHSNHTIFLPGLTLLMDRFPLLFELG
jgi:hypothetical protein